jgi:RND family efflux transporter MFP subunit
VRARHILLVAACCLAVILLLSLILHINHHRAAASEAPPAPPSVSVAIARTGSIADQLTVAGIFQPFQEIDIHGKVSGYTKHIYVDIGDRVRKGQTLAVHANYARLKQASDQQPGLVAAQELDDALAHDRTAAAQIEAAKSAVAAAQGQLGVSRAEDLRVSSLEQYATITAPYNGVVIMRYADNGSLIPAGTAEGGSPAVVRLAQSDVLRLRMPVPERDVPMVRLGSLVTVHVQATGQQFPGTVVRFTRDVSNATRTMLTEVDVQNPSLTLTPGMYADVTFNLQVKSNAIVVPSSAIIDGDQPSVLLVYSANRIERRPIVLGISGANSQEVSSGLQPGDRIIIGGLSTLQPGQRVSPQTVPSDLANHHQEGKKGEQ